MPRIFHINQSFKLATAAHRNVTKPVNVTYDAAGLCFTRQYIGTNASWSYNMLTWNILRKAENVRKAYVRIGTDVSNYEFMHLDVLHSPQRFAAFMVKHPSSGFSKVDRKALVTQVTEWLFRAYDRTFY